MAGLNSESLYNFKDDFDNEVDEALEAFDGTDDDNVIDEDISPAEESGNEGPTIEEPDDTPPVSEEETDAGSEQSSTDEKSLEAPASYSAEEKDAFKALPKAAQQIAVRLEEARRRHFTAQTEDLGKTRRLYDGLERVLAPAQGYFVEMGVTPDQWVSGMLQTQAYLDRDPVGGLKALANRLGVDPRQLIEEPAQSEAVDPRARVLQERLGRLESEINFRKQAEERSLYEHQFNTAVEFRSEKDAQGNLKRPFLAVDEITNAPKHPEFAQRMMIEMQILQRANNGMSPKELLEAAYNNALYVVPAARESLEAERRKKDALTAQEKAKQAKRKAKPTSSLGANGPSAPSAKTLDEEIDALFA